uniref:Granulins domain-containing protein n=1 Tax=Ciona savignyi TaxID=51511 RepID=H2Z8I8_CIOSA
MYFCNYASYFVVYALLLSGSVTLDVLANVMCDTSHYCPSGNTCCKLSSGQWGCCPLPKAVCCKDQKHCCPSGYTCGVSGLCIRISGSKVIPWLTKTESLVQQEERVPARVIKKVRFAPQSEEIYDF